MAGPKYLADFVRNAKINKKCSKENITQSLKESYIKKITTNSGE